MVHNNLGFEFAYAVHSGVFTEYEPPFKEPSFKEPEPEPTPPPPPLTRTGYENSLPVEDLLIRDENVILNLDPEVEFPWKLAD